MEYTVKTGILKFSIVSATAAIALSTATNAWSANLTFVNSRTALGGNDFVDWSSPISPIPVQTGTRFTISSAGGLVVTGDLAGDPGEVRRQNTGSIVGVNSPSNSNATQNSTFWNGNFAPNDAVYWNKGNGPLSLTFATPVSSVGTQLDSLFYRDSVAANPLTLNPPSTSPFKGTITAFFGSSGASTTFTANGITNALADNSATFFGVQSDTADITKIVFDNFDIPTDSRYFNYAINRVSIGNSTIQAVPEPFTIIGSFLGGAAALKMRKRLKANNKL